MTTTRSLTDEVAERMAAREPLYGAAELHPTVAPIVADVLDILSRDGRLHVTAPAPRMGHNPFATPTTTAHKETKA